MMEYVKTYGTETTFIIWTHLSTVLNVNFFNTFYILNTCRLHATQHVEWT